MLYRVIAKSVGKVRLEVEVEIEAADVCCVGLKGRSEKKVEGYPERRNLSPMSNLANARDGFPLSSSDVTIILFPIHTL